MSTETQKAANKWFYTKGITSKAMLLVKYEINGVGTEPEILRMYLAEHPQPAEQSNRYEENEDEILNVIVEARTEPSEPKEQTFYCENKKLKTCTEQCFDCKMSMNNRCVNQTSTPMEVESDKDAAIRIIQHHVNRLYGDGSSVYFHHEEVSSIVDEIIEDIRKL